MKLREYIKEQVRQSPSSSKKKEELAALFGVSASSVHSWSTGWRHPERKRWNTIVAKTNGAVTLEDLVSSGEEAA
jgi:DNA-binding transcriptional regulator YdaS (Cro superfamily)